MADADPLASLVALAQQDPRGVVELLLTEIIRQDQIIAKLVRHRDVSNGTVKYMVRSEIRLAKVLFRGRFTWDDRTATKLSPNHSTILRCLLADDGTLRGPVSVGELLVAVYGKADKIQLKALRKSVDQLRTKLHRARMRAVTLRWTRKGELEMVQTNTPRGDCPKSRDVSTISTLQAAHCREGRKHGRGDEKPTGASGTARPD